MQVLPPRRTTKLHEVSGLCEGDDIDTYIWDGVPFGSHFVASRPRRRSYSMDSAPDYVIGPCGNMADETVKMWSRADTYIAS